MLNFLSINNIVLIDKAEINFSAGFCVLSGETGSGKSILLDSLGLAIGFRSNLRLIGSNDNKARIIAEFDISKNPRCQEILQENDLIDAENSNFIRIRRSIQVNSQGSLTNKNIVNDIAIGANLLGNIGETLIEIHGQHDQRGLLNSSSHGEILDEFAQNNNLLKDLKSNYDQLKQAEAEIAQLKAKQDQSEREKDYLEHVIQELESADIQGQEEEDLISRKDKLVGKEKILKFLSELKSQLTEANSQLISSQRTLIRNNNIIDNFLPDSQEEFEKISVKIDQQNSEIDSAISGFDDIIRDVSTTDDNLDEIEERLFLIRSLARKFSVSIEELPNIILQSQEKLKLISREENLTLDLEKQLSNLKKEYQKIANELDKRRKRSALILSKKVEEELISVKMAGVKFIVDISNNDSTEPQSPRGYNKIRFLASINKNNPDDISKIASGGELSRFMLALKVSLMDVKSAPTIIFDEIDTGIGGSTADAVGKRLKSLSKSLQILVVTHQPQIAAKSDTHFKISKISDGSKIKTIIESLDKENREEEIARMLSGKNISNEALAAAKKLISDN